MPIYYNRKLAPEFFYNGNNAALYAPGEGFEIHYNDITETRRRLQQCRKQKNWTIEQFAKVMQYNVDYAKGFEIDDLMSLHNLDAISKLYGKPISYFLVEEEKHEQLVLF